MIWLLSWGLVAPTGAVSVDSAPKLTIRSFKIIGARTVKPKSIWAEILTPRPSIWPWKKPPVYDPEDLNEDLNRIKALYRRQGFYHTRVRSKVKPLPDNQVEIQVIITEGPWIKVSQVNLSLAAVEKVDLASLLEDSPLKPGQRFTESGYDDLKKLILNHLLDHGYPKARVEGEVLVYTEPNLATVLVQAWPGPLCRFGPIQVRGEKLETPETLIRHRLTFRPGDTFSLAKIYESQTKLYALDLFQSVMVTPEKVPESQREIPITVTVQEKKKHSLKLGLGYGSEDEIRGQAILRFRNLAGGGRILDFKTKYSRLETSLEGAFQNRQIFNTLVDLNINFGSLRRYLPAFTDKSLYTRAQLEREFPWKIKGYVGHGLEFSRPYNIPIESLERLTETEPGKTYRASMLLWGFSRDSTDDPIDPQRGGLLSLSSEFAPGFFGSQLQFIQTIMELRRYQSLGWKNFVLAGRVKFGLIEPIQQTQEIPIFRRFFSGGAGSMRGYRLDYLGPRNRYGEPLGGDSLLEASLEFRFPIYKDLRGVAFMDCGNVYWQLGDTDPGNLKYASGFGLRYQTPIGPIGVDIAWPLNPIDPDRDKYQINFTIGQSF